MERTDKMSELDQTLTLPHFKQNIQMFLIPQIFLPLNSADQLNHCRYGGASGRDGSHLRHQLLRQRDGPEDAAEEPRWGAGAPPAGHGRRLLRGDDDHRDGARGADQVPPPGGLHSDRQLSVCAQFEGWGQVWESEPDICVSSLQPTVILMISVFSQLKLTPGTTHPSQLRRGIREFVFLLPRIIFPELCEGCCELRLVFLSAVRTQNSPSYVWWQSEPVLWSYDKIVPDSTRPDQTREQTNDHLFSAVQLWGGERETLHPVMPDIIAGPAGGGGGGPDPVLWTSGRGSVSLQAGRTQEHL